MPKNKIWSIHLKYDVGFTRLRPHINCSQYVQRYKKICIREKSQKTPQQIDNTNKQRWGIKDKVS